MRICSSDIVLTSSQINIISSSKHESLHMWDKHSDVTSAFSQENMELQVKKTTIKDKVDISSLNNPIIHEIPANTYGNNSDDTINNLLDGSLGDIRLQLVKAIIEMMTGREIKVLDPSDMTRCDNEASAQSAPDARGQALRANQRTPQGWGMDYYFNETHYSKEGASFNASGSVKTADGKIVNFAVSLEMSRETFGQRVVSLKAGDALIDPLVIDLSGTGVSFSNVKFEFDLAANGEKKVINAPAAGSGFLAYDRNGNGLIDDGSELFGPATGNGFHELAGLDNDRNGWIDENDEAFSSMKIWQKNSDGADLIQTLREKDVGALYCGSAPTLFDATAAGDPAGAVAGRLKETGMWLTESGGAGIVQEFDMVV